MRLPLALAASLVSAPMALGCSTPEAKPLEPSAAAPAAAEPTAAEPAPLPAASAEGTATPPPAAEPSAAPAPEQLGNPATAYCTKQGGKVEMVKVEGADRALCAFDDGSRCEAWSFKRGECSRGSCRAASGVCTESK